MSAKYAFSKSLKELRFHFCQTSEPSSGLRQFLQKSYPVMKKHNPATPLLVREAFGVPPKIWARYEMGKEASVAVDGMSSSEVEKALQELAQKST